mgnify:CR=1 FL=1
MTINVTNLFDSMPGDLEQEVFSTIVQSENVKVERIVSRGHTSPASGWHDQVENEWVIVLAGEARLLFEDNREVHLLAGGYINIPSHTKHKVIWTPPDIQTVWLAIHYT